MDREPPPRGDVVAQRDLVTGAAVEVCARARREGRRRRPARSRRCVISSVRSVAIKATEIAGPSVHATEKVRYLQGFTVRRSCCVFRESSLTEGVEFRFDGWVGRAVRRRATEREREGRTGMSNGRSWLGQSELRELLFPSEPAVRGDERRPVRDLPTSSARGAAAAEPAALRVPPGAADAGRLGVPVGPGAGSAARVAVESYIFPARVLAADRRLHRVPADRDPARLGGRPRPRRRTLGRPGRAFALERSHTSSPH